MTLPMGDGNPAARIMLVGETWAEGEEREGRPFVGSSGLELDRMLHEVGIMRSETYATNVVNARPTNNDLGAWVAMKKKDITHKHVMLKDKFVLPIVEEGYQSLLKEIELIKPNIIIAFGNFAMWALTSQWGILKWRGSQLTSDFFPCKTIQRKVIPTIHPAGVLRDYSLRQMVLNDLRRAAEERNSAKYTNVPERNFIIRPSLQMVLKTLAILTKKAEAEGHLWVEFDLETSPIHITCAGISWSKTDAICIPITCSGNAAGYWSEEEEAIVVFQIYKFLTNPKIWVRGQNLLYDAQHTYRHWHFVPNVKQDIMLSHHTMFAGMPKSLSFQASLYCDYYIYWKEMHKDMSNKIGA